MSDPTPDPRQLQMVYYPPGMLDRWKLIVRDTGRVLIQGRFPLDADAITATIDIYLATLDPLP